MSKKKKKNTENKNDKPSNFYHTQVNKIFYDYLYHTTNVTYLFSYKYTLLTSQ